jgi:hypothetical protein
MKRLTSEMEEKLPGLFEPTTILPVQYFTRLQRSAAWTGEQRLMAAIMEDAVAVCSKPSIPKSSKARHVLRETLRWVRSNDRTWMFSFLRICEMLDLEPSAIRRGIRIMRGEESAASLCHLPTREVAELDALGEIEPPRRAAAG